MTRRFLGRGRARAALASAGAALVLLAIQDVRAQDGTQDHAQDAAATAGANIAALGNGHGSPACASCHTFNGVADPSGAFPRLAGLSAAYMRTQLDAFASGDRANAVMSPIAMALTPDERASVATYYSTVSAPIPPQLPSEPALVERGRLLATLGSEEKKIPACAACHGPFGVSPNPTIPSLQGQYASYILFELSMFREGFRKQGAEQMKTFSHVMDEGEANAVAAYFQQARMPDAATLADDIKAGDPQAGK
jgi:cytochrome c553